MAVATTPFLATIMPWSCDFEPRNWMFCRGQALQISQYQALYTLIGTLYGGDGRTYFNLPDLRGRLIIGQGMAPGIGNYPIGTKSGMEQVNLNESQMPIHAHSHAGNLSVTFKASTDTADTDTPMPNAILAKFNAASGLPTKGYNSGPGDVELNAGNKINGNMALGFAGASAPHTNMMPFTTCNYLICVVGIFPSRQ